MSLTQADLDGLLADIFGDEAPISRKEAETRIGQGIGRPGCVYITSDPDEDGTRKMSIASVLGHQTKLDGPAPPPRPTYMIREEFARYIV